MTKYFLRALLCLFLLLPIGAVAERSFSNFSNVVVLGNSLSDTGNVAAFSDASATVVTRGEVTRVGLCFFDFDQQGPPFDLPDFPCDELFFDNSRVSNGPVAVEVLAKRLGFEDLRPSLHVLPLIGLPRPLEFGTNYAVAGARAAESGPGDLGAQLAAFLFDHSPAAPSDALYVVFIGGNDLRDARGAMDDEMSNQIIADAVSAIDATMRQLISVGAKTFLVINVPDIGSLPETRIVGEAVEQLLGIPAQAFIKRATDLTRQFNKQLSDRVRQIELDQEQTGNPIELREFDLFTFFRVIRLFGKLFGLNTDDACFDSSEYRDTGNRVFHPGCGEGRFNRFIFFDDIHPTGLVHAIVGQALFVTTRRPLHRRSEIIRLRGNRPLGN